MNQSTMLSPKAYEKKPFPQTLSLFQGYKNPFKILKLQLQIWIPQFKSWSQLGGYATGQNRPQLPCITTHHPEVVCSCHPLAPAIIPQPTAGQMTAWFGHWAKPLASCTAISSGLAPQAVGESP